MAENEFDLIVIGGGPAGASGANTAAMLGKRVALVEQERLIGGAGLNTGTVPSKTLRETALALSGWRSRQLFGVDLSLRREATTDDLMHHADSVSAAERARVETRLHALHVERILGVGSFVDPNTIRVAHNDGTESLLRGERILIASGSSPLRPAMFAFEDDRIHDSNELLHLTELPKRLVVVGAGVIGCEYACTFAAMDVKTHLVDGRPELLSFLDDEVSTALTRAMEANGVRLRLNENVVKCDSSQPGDVILTLSSGITLAADGVLVCAGRSSNTDKLNLPAAGITLGKRGLIPVDDHLCSVVPHIYAAGDVIGPPALAATGIEQARRAMFHAFGVASIADSSPLLPSGIYTIPEVSYVGETEEELKQKNVPYIVGRAYYSDSPRGRIVGDETGFLKLLYRRSDMRLLGVHVLGEHATELVHIGLVAMLASSAADLFVRACFNYPTLGELYKDATHNALLERDRALLN